MQIFRCLISTWQLFGQSEYQNNVLIFPPGRIIFPSASAYVIVKRYLILKEGRKFVSWCDGHCWTVAVCLSQVWAAIPPWKQGSLAEFVVLSANEVKSEYVVALNQCLSQVSADVCRSLIFWFTVIYLSASTFYYLYISLHLGDKYGTFYCTALIL